MHILLGQIAYLWLSKSEIAVVDPKAHGIGFLYPPKNSPKGWEESVPQWSYELWDCILRDALKLRKRSPDWLDIPQMMRITITTYNVLEMLGEWKTVRPYNFLLLPMVDPTFGCAFPKSPNERVLLICPFSSKQEEWFHMECINVHTGETYKMVDCTKAKNVSGNVVFPLQFAHLMRRYQQHPEAKSLSPEGTCCKPETTGLLQRAHVEAGDIRYIGKETDRKWEEGDDVTVLEFKNTEYGRSHRIAASEQVKKAIQRIGINKCARESGFDRKSFVRKLVRGLPVKRTSYLSFLDWLNAVPLS